MRVRGLPRDAAVLKIEVHASLPAAAVRSRDHIYSSSAVLSDSFRLPARLSVRNPPPLFS